MSTEFQTKRVALYQSVRHAGAPEVVFGQSDDDATDDNRWGEYARITEFVDVKFVARSVEDTVTSQLAVLDEAEANLRTQMQALEHARRRILCLTHE